MAQILCKMELDVAECAPGMVLMAKQGDFGSRFVQVRLTSHRVPIYIPEDAAVLLNVKRPDGEVRAFAGSVNGDGTLTLPVGGWMLEVKGVLLCDISVTDGAGCKLTSTCFSIFAEGAVCPDGELGSESESVTARFLSERQLFDLSAIVKEGVAVLSPRSGRNYQLDLSGAPFKNNGAWMPIRIELPADVTAGEAGRILLRVHAPKERLAEYPAISFGTRAIFRQDDACVLTADNADIFCTYAPKAGKWQIFVQNYGEAGASPSARLTLGESATTAYRGDRGAVAYAHAVTTTGNPHGITPAGIGAATPAYVDGKVAAITAESIGAATPAYVDSKVAAAGPGVEVRQATGESTADVMSQKAVTDALNAITPAKIGAATPAYVDGKETAAKSYTDSAVAAAMGTAEAALAEV